MEGGEVTDLEIISKFGTIVLFSTCSFANDEYFKFACKEKLLQALNSTIGNIHPVFVCRKGSPRKRDKFGKVVTRFLQALNFD